MQEARNGTDAATCASDLVSVYIVVHQAGTVLRTCHIKATVLCAVALNISSGHKLQGAESSNMDPLIESSSGSVLLLQSQFALVRLVASGSSQAHYQLYHLNG